MEWAEPRILTVLSPSLYLWPSLCLSRAFSLLLRHLVVMEDGSGQQL